MKVPRIYRFAKFIFKLLSFTPFIDFRISHKENVPEQGPLVIASKHLSYLDPPVLVHALDNHFIRFMAKKELFDIKWLKKIITDGGAFPVNRGTFDRLAIKTAISILAESGTLGYFAEGTTHTNRETIGELGSGLSLMLSSGQLKNIPVQILPVGLAYKKTRFLGLPKFIVSIEFGEPFFSTKIGQGHADVMNEVGEHMSIALKKAIDNCA